MMFAIGLLIAAAAVLGDLTLGSQYVRARFAFARVHPVRRLMILLFMLGLGLAVASLLIVAYRVLP